MSQSQDYGFCPNCGAVSRNGVCTSCGYKKRNGKFNKTSGNAPVVSEPGKTVFDYTAPGNGTPSYTNPSAPRNTSATGRKGGYGIFVFAALAGLVVFLLIFLIYHSYRFGKNETVKSSAVDSSVRGTVSSASVSESTSVSEDSSLEIDDRGDDSTEVFSYRVYNDLDTFIDPEATADAEAVDYEYWNEYDYYVYSDCIRTDLNYKMVNNVWKYNGYKADEYGIGFPEDAFIRYEFFTVESDTLAFTDRINDIIEDTTTYICDYYEGFAEYLGEDEVFYGEGFVYVAYMSEDVLSLIFTFNGYFYDEEFEEEENDPVFYTMKAANFDMKTGRLLNMPRLAMSDDEFIDKLITDINSQYETDMLEYVSREDFAEAFDNRSTFWFYTPLGVEFVYCFPDLYGYYSCTEDPNEVFAK